MTDKPTMTDRERLALIKAFDLASRLRTLLVTSEQLGWADPEPIERLLDQIESQLVAGPEDSNADFSRTGFPNGSSAAMLSAIAS